MNTVAIEELIQDYKELQLCHACLICMLCTNDNDCPSFNNNFNYNKCYSQLPVLKNSVSYKIKKLYR